jgi:histidyl-tRNA synthetase
VDQEVVRSSRTGCIQFSATFPREEFHLARPEPRLVKGFRDIFARDVALKREMIDAVRRVYERYGYIPLETPAVEFVDVLGKFLPEADKPDGGIFAFRNPDVGDTGTTVPKRRPIFAGPDDWLSLRYDLTAPLARVAAQYVELPKPYRRYQIGTVWRYEKPGPGRFREFMQFDFDAVGTPHMAADAEVCCVICDAMEALGFGRSDYVVKVNDRKIMQGVLELCGAGAADSEESQKRALGVLRAIDKLDRLGEAGVIDLLGPGRKDESGDKMEGANLAKDQIDIVLSYLRSGSAERGKVIADLNQLVGKTPTGATGVAELRQIDEYLRALGYQDDRVSFDPTVIRGLAYYTGPVFEGVITRAIKDEDGNTRQFGSVYGGGRYDDLVERFTGVKVPATGASIGVDRMLEALKLIREPGSTATAHVLIVVVEPERMTWYLEMAQKLRKAGLNAEVYVGDGRFGKQVKYADAVGIPYALIAGGNELTRGVVQIKDMAAGAAASGKVASRDEWRKGQPAQREIPIDAVVEELRKLAGVQ